MSSNCQAIICEKWNIVMHSISPGAQARNLVKLGPLRLKHLPYRWLHAYTTVWICKQRLDAYENFRDGQGEAPIVLNGVKTHIAVPRNIWVKYSCDEPYLGWPHWVASNEMKEKK